MMKIKKLTFLSLLWVTMFFTSCNGQVKKYLPKENATVFTAQTKLIKTQGSTNKGNSVHRSLQDRKWNLWFATTSEGVYRYDGKSFTNFTTKNGLNSNATYSILEDKKGNIWIGTDSGLSHYDGKNFTNIPLSFTYANYLYPSALPNNKLFTNNFVTSILEDKSGKLWFGTDNGVYCYDGKAFTRFLDNQSVINNNGLTLQLVQCMLEDKHGNIWFNTKMEGVCRYDGKSLINYKPNDELCFYGGLLEDKNGNIWVGGRRKGICRYDGKAFTNILQDGRFDSSTVYSIIQDKTGNIWFGTEADDDSKPEYEGGVWRYDGKTFQNVSKKDGLSLNGVWSVLEDKSGNLWIGTRNTGLYRYDGKTFTHFSE